MIYYKQEQYQVTVYHLNLGFIEFIVEKNSEETRLYYRRFKNGIPGFHTQVCRLVK